ncbi:MAG: hypothetical protein ITF98_08140 [Fermentimonas sp.]|jgi:hypothetical protein|nr:hypothetical protein [Fermentimonas sp.]
MLKDSSEKGREVKKAPQKNLKEKRADKANKRVDKSRKGLDDLKMK